MKKSLKETNPYLQNEDKYYRALAINVLSSTEIETNMVYIVCTRKKSHPHKAIGICEHCQYNKKCKDYKQYLTLKGKEKKVMDANRNIPMFPIESKNIKSIGYNANTRTLRIEFKQGSFYDYAGVPPEIFQQIMVAESKGKFFRAEIKGRYAFNKVEETVKEG
jgi:hypothetical protein